MSLLPDNRPDRIIDPADAKAEGWVRELSDFVYKVARQIPHSHESQDKLIGDYYTQALAHFRNDHADTLPNRRGCRQGKSRSQVYVEYISMNAFEARLEAAKIMSPCLYLGFYRIDDAFASGEEVHRYGLAPQFGPFTS